MKQKIKLVLYLILASLFILPIQTVKAQTACTYSLRFWEINNTTAAQAGTQLNFRAEVTRGGNLANCSNSVNITGLYVINSTGSNPLPKIGTLNSVDFSTNIATQNFGYRVPSNIPPNSQIQFWAFTNLSGVPQSPTITINLSGSTGGGSGSVRVNVSLNPAKGSYKSGEAVQIFAQANTSDVNALPSGIQQIFIQFRVNGQNVGTLTKSRNEVAQSTQYLDTTVTTNHGFQFGSSPNTPNSINVSLWQTGGTGLKFGEGTATLQTDNQTSLPSVISDKQKTSIGDTVNFTIRNVAAGWSGSYTVNNDAQTEKELSNTNLALVISTANGFKDGRSNSVTFEIVDRNGNSIDLVNEGVVNIDVNPNNKTGGNDEKKFGCKMPDGKYTCSAQEMDAVLISCPTPPTLISSCWCDKTQEQINTQCAAGGGGGGGNDKLINPLPSDELLTTFLSITKGFLAGLALWAVIAIIFAGFRMVISAGNEEAITQAKKAITWAILGLVAALLSFSIVAIVQNILKVDTSKFDPFGSTSSNYNILTDNKKV